MKTSELKLFDRNPRTISSEAMGKLKASIERDPEFMTLRPIVVDETMTVLGGNQRLKAIRELGMDEIPDRWVARSEDLTDEQKRRFVVLDNLAAGEWDVDLLANEYDVSELDELGFDLKELGIDNENYDDERYSRKIVPPIYEPKGECPPIYDLYDDSKYLMLCQEIEIADISEEEKSFLKKAAERHTSFYFREIAEFYCHANSEVQELMEKSGLVIIDFDKAIEYGFVNLTGKLGKLADLEEKDA